MADNCGWLAPRDGQARDALERHLPTGVAWIAFRSPDKLASKVISAISGVFQDAWTFMCRMAAELDPRTTNDLIDNWEGAVALPDSCLPKATTLQQRRDQVMFRLAMRRWSTAQDWRDLAALFGLMIRITPGWHVQKPALYAYEYPKRYDLFPKLGRFRVYIDVVGMHVDGYDYGLRGSPGYPIPYGVQLKGLDEFMCLIERVRPSNVIVIWNDNPLFNGCLAESFAEEFEDTFCGVATGDGLE